MNYTKIQKFLSGLIIFSLLFGVTFRVPFIDYKTFAEDQAFFNIVSIIVNEEVYEDNFLKSKIDRYWKDIQNTLENTKVIILPTPASASAFQIASLNESLYFEWYKSLDEDSGFESKLIWTVLVWDFNLPIAYDKNNSAKTILPFTDFEDKVYIYNHKINKYEKNKSNQHGMKSEIWHWVISPNLWSNDLNKAWLRDYFDKNHDFYEASGNFATSNGILNWKKESNIPNDYKPFVFYYDQFREEKALNYNVYDQYKWYLQNKEDIIYNRFSKDLADKISQNSLRNATEVITGLIENINDDFGSLTSGANLGFNDSDQTLPLSGMTIPDTNGVPDIQTRHIIKKATKTFLESFSKWTLWEFRKDVHNAWRYNGTWSKVNVDMIPYLVSVLDLVNDEIIKDVNIEIEKQIDDLVKEWFSRKIAIPTKIEKIVAATWAAAVPICNGQEYVNYLYWKNAEDISQAEECSIYRWSNSGSWKLVEANRWLNINNIDLDRNEIPWTHCASNLMSWASLEWLWGGNSPFNLEMGSVGWLTLKSSDLKWAIVPLYDIEWSKKVTDDLKVPSPLNCLENNYLKKLEKGTNSMGVCWNIYEAGVSTWWSWEWKCTTDSNSLANSINFSHSFEDNYKNFPISVTYPSSWSSPIPIVTSNDCEKYTLYLDWSPINTIDHSSKSAVPCDQETNNDFYYKTIDSYIEHKSPTAEILAGQTRNMISQDLPVDRDRYIDFISAKWEYKSIEYPQLFRLNLSTSSDISLNTIGLELDRILNEKSAEINEKIRNNDPSSLLWDDLYIYNNYLNTGTYPQDNFDLYQILKDKADKTITIDWESKDLNYYDLFVFSLYWNNLTSVSAKYAFIFDNYLTDQFWVAEQNNKYYLPKNKKQYEISYLWANWDAENMYIKLDSESKAENPYWDIIGDNINLWSTLFGANIWDQTSDEEALFKCAPPDWVPIWEWIPAIFCRLWEMLPPSISFSAWECWSSSLFSDEDEDEQNTQNTQLTSLWLSLNWGIVTWTWTTQCVWINKCVENKLNNWDLHLELSSDSEKYYYNNLADLTASIKDSDWKVLKIANATDIHFEVEKIEAALNPNEQFNEQNIEIAYDITDIHNRDKWDISSYVSFSELKMRSSHWVAKYWIWLKSKEANIYLKAFINTEFEKVESESLKIEIRWDNFFNTSYKIKRLESSWLETIYWASSLKVSDAVNIFLSDVDYRDIDTIKNAVDNHSASEEKLIIFPENISSNWVRTDLSYPLIVSIKKGDNLIVEDRQISDINSFIPLTTLREAWSYNIEISDDDWFKTVKNIELLAKTPHSVEIRLGSSVMETWWNVSTSVVTILDEYDNPVSGEFYDLTMSIESGNSTAFLDSESEILETRTFEWYKIFRLKSSETLEWDNTIKVQVKDIQWNLLVENTAEVRVLNNIDFNVENISGEEIKVWWWTYRYKVSLKDDNGDLITDFNSRVYMVGNPLFIETQTPYVELVWWEAEIEFRTKTLAGQSIPIEFQVEWLNRIIQENIDVLPEAPVKIDLLLSQNKIEASLTSEATLNVELKDRYNNLVFNDDTTNTQIEILDQYKHIIISSPLNQTVSGWKTSYILSATKNPWLAYFKVHANWLENNSFTILEWTDNELTINWVNENAWKIETFYFWNKDKLDWKKYNSIYTTLIWSNYWDITQENYLAGSLLFEKENRALAVTSLLNNSYKYNNIINLDKSWAVHKIYSNNDLMQDIDITAEFDSDNKLWLNLYNKALNIYLWKIFYNFDEGNTELKSCDNWINNCFDENKTSIVLKSLFSDYNTIIEWDKLILRNTSGNDLLEISKNGTINRWWSVELEFDESNISEKLILNVKTGWSIVAKLWFNFKGADIKKFRVENIFNAHKTSSLNSILVFLKTPSYSTYADENSELFYYNDPFDSEFSLDTFTKNNNDWYENFVRRWSIWWKEWNKSLLAFAAWKTVGESVQDYMSFSVINLWDPVISLKKIKKKLPWTPNDRNFDSTIWKLLSKDDDILWYKLFDYDNDDDQDILLIKNSNYLKLLENIKGRFIDKWNLAFIVDMWAYDLVETWDFRWDWYEDIFFVNNKWDPFVLNNTEKDFSRLSLKDTFNLNGRIVRAGAFNMDNDKKDNNDVDDIVTLDDDWWINIFYGSDSTIIKKEVANGYWVTLSSDIRNDNSLVYFNGLYQPREVLVDVPNNYEPASDRMKKYMIDKYLFVKYPYSVWPAINYNTWAIVSMDDIWFDYTSYDSFDYDNFNYSDYSSRDTLNEIPEQSNNMYFVKSEYSEYSWLKVEKIFEDIDNWFVSSGDKIKVEITLKNVSGGHLDNIAFAEKVEDVFLLDYESITTTDTVTGTFNASKADMSYSFLVDWFTLNDNETITFTYEATVGNIQYSYLELWLFEQDESWDDLYGDIIVKANNENCGKNVEIFRSTAIRSYWGKDTKSPSCSTDAVELPEALNNNTIDSNNNGIPDYIDALTDTTSFDALRDYWSDILNQANEDSDWDWIPDAEDNFEMDDSITVNLSWDWSGVESALDSVESLMNWLSCWFGDASCFASPLNWAPLAPWSDPVLMWQTIWDWLNVDEWIPIFSALTWNQTSCWSSPCCLPSVWPAHSATFIPWPACWGNGAGWSLWTWSPTNNVRVFVSPTLTWWVWTAVCFWWPASIVGNSVPEWFSPLVPGWNCIVTAAKLFWCEDDGSDWDPASVGIPTYSSWNSNWDFSIINGNCSLDEEPDLPVKNEIGEYLRNPGSSSVVWDIFEFLPWNFSETPISSLFMDWNWWGVSITLDLSSSESSWDFEDIIKIEQTRISAFPEWLMDWVTRQIEEIANKLTDFPTIYVILPDFWWILDWDWSTLSWNNNVYEDDAISIDENLISENEYLDDETKKALWWWIKKVNSWIKEAYEFIWSTPLIKLEQETVNMTLPWISEAEINKIISDRGATLKQREDEVARAQEVWSSASIEDNVSLNATVEVDALINSLRQNIEVIKEYKKIPEKINKYLNKKEVYLEQILCNIESISNILWGRIWKNGTRFKTWVELYILIKAILKSWQLIVDVFTDYKEECKECKNERQDALDEEFSLIDMIMPDIPVIRFPKWPDLIIDLHNIRAWLTILLPEFNVTTKPILLPTLPELHLPDDPNINIGVNLNLPELPVLPNIEIPELPDLPSLPTVELPDLPPPPKLPKLLSSIEVVLDILKLVLKAMCILKSSPLHPEWRAWDQIAFLTERNWFLWGDFFNLSLPEFSFPFLDAIKVTTYVNLEIESDFLVEMARQVAMPINSFTNDFTNIFSIDPNMLDLRNTIPEDINVDVNIWWDWAFNNNSDELKMLFAERVALNMLRLTNYIKDNKNEEVSNLEFRKLINESLASKTITSDPRTQKIIDVWKQVENKTYSKENELIKQMQDNNRNKFDTLKDIVNTEIIKNNKLRKKLKNIWEEDEITKVSFSNINNIGLYNNSLSIYNNNFVKSAKNLINSKWDIFKNSLQESKETLLNSIKTPLQNYSSKANTQLLSSVLATTPASWSSNPTTCQSQAESDYKYIYKWLYVLEWDSSYKLIDYSDELYWDETTQIVDVDNDSDEDLIYFANGQLFLKYNLENNDIVASDYVSEDPILLNAVDNKFYNTDIFYEAVNNFREVWNDTGNINLNFSASTNDSINKFRIWLYTIVDKYLNESDENYTPVLKRKSIIDAVSWIDNSTISLEPTPLFIQRDNLVRMEHLNHLLWVKLKTKELTNIKQQVDLGNIVNITKWTRLYAWWDSFTIDWVVEWTNQFWAITVWAYKNIELLENITINSITANAYVKWFEEVELEWDAIRTYHNLPLFPWSKISHRWLIYENSALSYIDLRYHDDSTLWIDFNKVDSWELYDLWQKSENYYVRVNKNNDYYYAKINSFKDNIDSTLSNQILLAPQIKADQSSPILYLHSIRIPIYQEQTVDITQEIYESSWIKGIAEVIVDLDLEVDSDGDWNTKNDIYNTTWSGVVVEHNDISIKLKLWSFEELFTKNIGVTLVDDNGNDSFKEVSLEVYTPAPEITSYTNWTISWNISESLTDEPVNIYRFRAWTLSKLENIDRSGSVNTTDWSYTFEVDNSNGEWLVLTNNQNDTTLANINETTWKIDLSAWSSNLDINVILNDYDFPSIVLLDNWVEIFREYIRVEWVNKVNVVSDFNNISTSWIYFKFATWNHYASAQIPETVAYNPWALYIHRQGNDSQAIFTIFKDWRINPININSYTAEYENVWDNVVLILKDDVFGREVWRVLFKVESDYIIE
jgi:hypothetical protein